jgi:hypothetical protein
MLVYTAGATTATKVWSRWGKVEMTRGMAIARMTPKKGAMPRRSRDETIALWEESNE